MQLTSYISRPPHLVPALEALAKRADHQEEASILFQELRGITVLVAKRYTNDRTADGLLEAFYLTVGCVSLGISQADIPTSNDARLNFLLQHGAERVFQMGFRHIKELAGLPYVAFVSDFDRDPFVQQRNVKALFSEICRADPGDTWSGDEVYKRSRLDRLQNQKLIACAQWLRKKHFAGPVHDSDLDAHAVIAIAVIFGLLGDGHIVARTGQKEIEALIRQARVTSPDTVPGWYAFIAQIPPEFQPILEERMAEYCGTIIKKILSKTKIKTVLTEMQDFYAGTEQDVDYP